MAPQEANKLAYWWKLLMVGSVMMFLVGVLVGYKIWGERGKEVDVSQLLSRVEQYIVSLEKEKGSLNKKLSDMQVLVDKGKKALQTMEEMKQDLVVLQKKNKRLLEQVKDYPLLKEKVEELNALKAENEKLKKEVWEKTGLAEQVKKLKNENDELKATLQKVKEAMRKQNTLPGIEQPAL